MATIIRLTSYDYVSVIGALYPTTIVQCFGDPGTYSNLVHISGPAIPSQATLDADKVTLLAVEAAAELPGFIVSVPPGQTYTYEPRTMTGTANQITITNSDGSGGDPTFAIATNPIVPGTGSLTLPKGSTAQEPGAPVSGMLRYNTTSNIIEWYDGASWVQPGVTATNLNALTDVTITGPTSGQVLSYDGAQWVNATIGVSTFSAGTTGLTPSSPTAGAITLAGTLNAVNGGTGQSTYVVGDLLYANTTTTLAKLADVATGNALISGGVSTAPLWGKVGLTTHVTGVLPVSNGGTNLSTTPTNGQLLIGNGTNYTLATLTPGAGINVTNGSGTITVASTITQGLTDPGANGIVVRTALNTTTNVSLASGTGITIVNNDGTAGNPTIALTVPVTAPDGGTGQSTYTVGDLLYANTTTTLSKLTDAALGNALISGGVGLAPSYGKIGLTTHVSGTLPATSGGTNQSTYTVGDILYADTTTTLAKLIDAATGNALISGGAGVAPAYGKIGLTTHVSGTLPATSGGTNQSTYTVGDILYADTTTTLAKLTDAALGNALISGGAGVAPSYGKIGLTTAVTGVLPVANGGTNLSTTPTNGQLLIGNGTNYTLATLTAGTGISVTNGAGTVTVATDSSVPRVLSKTVVDATIITAGPNNTFNFSVPGGTLGTTGILRLHLGGRFVTAGTNTNVTIGVAYGGTTLYSDVTANTGATATRAWEIQLSLIANNSTSSQKLLGRIFIGTTAAVTTGVIGDLATVTGQLSDNTIIGNNGATDSTTAQTFNVAVTFSNATAVTWTKHFHTLELL